MIADLNVIGDIGEDGMPKPHVHVMLTMRDVDEDGFGKKQRDWNRTEMVERWREPRRKADKIRVQRYYDQKLVAPGAAFRIRNALA